MRFLSKTPRVDVMEKRNAKGTSLPSSGCLRSAAALGRNLDLKMRGELIREAGMHMRRGSLLEVALKTAMEEREWAFFELEETEEIRNLKRCLEDENRVLSLVNFDSR